MGLFGDWGAGKTSIMEQPQKGRSEEQPYQGRFRFAWFNAWEYELTENPAAALAQEVVQGLTQDINIDRSMHGFGLRTAKQLFWDTPRSFAQQLKVRIRYAALRHGWSFAIPVMILAGVVVSFSLLGYFGREIMVWVDQLPREGAAAWLINATAASFGVASLVWIITLGKRTRDILRHPISDKIKTYLRLPAYRKHLGLIPELKQDIDILCKLRLKHHKELPHRLIVFVDDLDRCRHAWIAQTFDAVRLLMTSDTVGVIVLIAIDHRIAFKAVGQQYKELADDGRSIEDIAREYMEKIIQLPLHLTRSEPESIRKFIHQGLFANARQASGTSSGDQSSTTSASF